MANFNDLQSRAWKRFHGTASGDAAIPAGSRIHLIVLASSTAASTLAVFNAATATGSDLVRLSAAGNASATLSLGANGSIFGTGVSTTLAGTSATYTLFYSEN